MRIDPGSFHLFFNTPKNSPATTTNDPRSAFGLQSSSRVSLYKNAGTRPNLHQVKKIAGAKPAGCGFTLPDGVLVCWMQSLLDAVLLCRVQPPKMASRPGVSRSRSVLHQMQDQEDDHRERRSQLTSPCGLFRFPVEIVLKTVQALQKKSTFFVLLAKCCHFEAYLACTGMQKIPACRGSGISGPLPVLLDRREGGGAQPPGSPDTHGLALCA